MFQIIPIGKVFGNGSKVVIAVEKAYQKALLHVEKFSHVHILTLRQNGDDSFLHTRICEVNEIEKDCIHGECQKAYSGEEILVDIKPYFPCEDYIRSDKDSSDNNREVCPVFFDTENQEKYLRPIGLIRNTRGEIYIQLEQEPQYSDGNIKVFWWFDKFDDKRYRKVTTTKPPYENAPESGIFATRSPVRPNPVAVTVCRILRVDVELKRVYINQIEAFDKTPCIGVLPYIPVTDAIPNAKTPKWLEHWPQYNMEIEKCRAVREEFISARELLAQIESETKNNAGDTGIRPSSRNFDIPVHRAKGIVIRGAWENNLKGINVCVPYGKITAVVGVSGSGKSSLVNDTIYAECRRRMEYLGNGQNRLERPNVDEMTGCIPAVVISQNPIRGNSQSTIGTYTNAYDYLRMIYAAIGTRFCPDCGGEIIPIKEEKAVRIVSRYTKTDIRITNLQNKTLFTKQDLKEQTLVGKAVHEALEQGKGAFYLCLEDETKVLIQTKQKCYSCNRLMFELKPSTFNYSDGDSRCPKCAGTGFVVTPDRNKIITKPQLSLLDGASPFYGKLSTFLKNPNANWMKGQVIGLARKMGEDLSKPWEDLSEEFRNKILYGSDEIVSFTYDNKNVNRKGEITRKVEGIYSILERTYDESGAQSAEAFMTKVPCDVCEGERLNAEGRAVTVANVRYPKAAAMSFRELSVFLHKLNGELTQEQAARIKNPVNSLNEILEASKLLGIDYLNLNRCTLDISGGEGQRVKLLAALLNHMSGILYLFDEPSKGLHPSDYKRVGDMMLQLKKEGNTIVMVEHNEDMIRIADNIIEIGPGAGRNGGNLMGEGSLSSMLTHMGTNTARYLGQQEEKANVKKTVIGQDDFVILENLHFRNLKDIRVMFPKCGMTCICGVSGSGKSTLLKHEIYNKMLLSKEFDEVLLVDQNPIGRNSKSVVATYIGIMDDIRTKMAGLLDSAEHGFTEEAFSFNREAGELGGEVIFQGSRVPSL